MKNFTPPRDRDAWATFRGYVYQIELTIKRWLELKPNQILELERGEDIDIISNSFIDSKSEDDRILEQVKHRQSKLSLRTPAALSAIANYIEHRKANTDSNILYRYTTNSQVTTERVTILPDSIPAILAWQQIRNGELEEKTQDIYIDGILNILNNSKKPAEINTDTWKGFKEFFQKKGASEILDLIRGFEWSTGEIAYEQIKSFLEESLIKLGHADDISHAEEQYQRLFLYTIKLLCKPDLKQLTPKERDNQLALPKLDDQDKRLLNRVNSQINELTAKFTNLVTTVREHSKNLSNINEQMREINKDKDIRADIEISPIIPILDIPPSVTHLCKRENTVNNLSNKVSNQTWTAIHGIIGSGKTQLLILLTESFGSCKAWVRFRDLDLKSACIQFDAVITELEGSTALTNRTKWYNDLCKNLNENDLIIFDDLPQFAGNDGLSERLTQFVKVCSKYNLRIISTSPFKLPQQIIDSLSGTELNEIEVPKFNDDEAADIFKSYEAPSDLESNVVQTINTIAKKHPAILTAIAKYLKQNQWEISIEVIEGLFKQRYATSLNEDTINRILESVEGEDSRELLYRMNLIIQEFSYDEVKSVAQVKPVIRHPLEHLGKLGGLWVQRDENDRYSVSPLLKVLGNENLSMEVRKNCYRSLGKLILNKPKINQFDSLHSITYFLGSEDFNAACVLLITSLSELMRLEALHHDSGLMLIWTTTRLPKSIELYNKIMLRGLQISTKSILEQDTQFLLTDFKTLVNEATKKESWAVFTASMMVLSFIVLKQPSEANYLLSVSMKHQHQFIPPKNTNFKIPLEIYPLKFLWINTAGIKTEEQINDWMETLEQFSAESRIQALDDEIADMSCVSLSEILWIKESEKQDKNQRWEKVLKSCDTLAEKSLKLGMELLWACFIRSQIIVASEFQNDLEKALAIYNSAIKTATEDPKVQFILMDSIGRQYIVSGLADEGLKVLDDAFNLPTDSFPENRVYSLIWASKVASNLNMDDAIPYLEKAVEISQMTEEVSETLGVKALGELSIAKWLAEDIYSAFDSWNKTGEQLLSCKMDTLDWRDLFVLFGHVSGYFMSIASTGYPPKTISGGEEYGEPTRGMFLSFHPDRSKYYDESRESIIYGQLAMYAESVGKTEQAAKWSIKGMDRALEDNQGIIITELSILNTPRLLNESKYAEVLEFALRSGLYQTASEEANKEGVDHLSSDFKPERYLSDKSLDIRKRAEYNAGIVGIVPIAFYLGILSVNDEEEAKIDSEEVVLLLKQISESAKDKTLWTVAEDIIRKTYDESFDRKDLRVLASNINAVEYNTLSIIGHIGSTLNGGISINQSLADHISIMRNLEMYSTSHLSIYNNIYIKFFVNYWNDIFAKRRFMFNAPILVEDSLSEAMKKEGTERARLVLQAIADSLGVNLPPDYKTWLYPSSTN